MDENVREKAIAVSVDKKGCDREKNLEHLDELQFLAVTAGAEIVEKFYQELEKSNRSVVVGKGKLEEIKLAILDNDITLVIFDNDLSPAQLRNLETSLKVKVIDRSGLILDIFARHARTTEARLQVELAQNEYLLPRLTRLWTHLSKQYGGIRTKGPGETQIETDRRMLRTRIQRLKEKLKDLDVQREQQKKGREDLPRFALVGYTNAGKSTLMNCISGAGVYVQDKLFATLDTTVRKFKFDNGQKALISDTVGFIRKLPSHLVASFRSTLAEAKDADVLIHVVDITHPSFRDQIRVVNKTLEQLRIDRKPTVLVMNKIDALQEDHFGIKALEEEFPNCLMVSAHRGINVTRLLETMQLKYDETAKPVEFMLPYAQMGAINDIYKIVDIKERSDTDDGILFHVRVPRDKAEYFEAKFGRYVINPD